MNRPSPGGPGDPRAPRQHADPALPAELRQQAIDRAFGWAAGLASLPVIAALVLALSPLLAVGAAVALGARAGRRASDWRFMRRMARVRAGR